ncbi:MAG: hypothetical protein E6R07_09730 [Nevskiaceae bacterium]|nr:MAG: hypothetical protein E6R07_09730 [Nevskiaceae bacterium]
MHKTLFLAALALSAVASTAAADTLAMPETAAEAKASAPLPAPAATPASISLPAKGISMAEVVKKFGEPRAKHPPVGGGEPRQPPITRWDYENFSVFFEHSHVIHAVIPDHPAELHHTEELKPAP